MSGSSRFLAEASEFRKLCKNKVLPFWQSVGIDESGAFYERMKADGQPDFSADRRVRVQCRQVYAFAHASTLGWIDDADRVCDRATSELAKHAVQRDADGTFDGVVNSLTHDGQIADPTRDLYTHAFLLLALAWRRKAFGDETAIQLADEVLDYLDRRLKANNGGWFEGLPQTNPRRQNPHMHLFEAFLALAEATGEERFLQKARTVWGLFDRVFFDHDNGNLHEFFGADWTRCGKDGHIVEPGHMMEWAWLLDKYGALTGEPQVSLSQRLYTRALAVGRDRASGLLVDRISSDGTPVWSRRRLWPQTELVKASIAMGRMGDPSGFDVAADALEQLRTTYFNVSIDGLWRERYDESGGAIPGPVPASSLYHIICCAAEVEQVSQVSMQPRAIPA